ncbi:hypothetical protein [Variovorax sp. JS1663]|uniref:hypothetical protein n=1 Tax=Variovorax sp. JS1663 TaxID=1851577 RepID=UPI000B3473C9|nr:hypothetical protein A8M77_00915 [Variovorax sp. JS1663]
MKNPPKMFLITGAGSGLGRAFAEAALQAGHRMVGTVRREDDRIACDALHPARLPRRYLKPRKVQHRPALADCDLPEFLAKLASMKATRTRCTRFAY